MRGRTGTAQLRLHGGRAPAWLLSRMVQLAREITIHIDRSERVKALKRLVRFGEERVRTRGRAAHGLATTVVDNERGSE